MGALLAALALVLWTATASAAVGFQQLIVADSTGTPHEVGIWSPATGRGLPLVVILHGMGGSYGNHTDTAMALAEAGFVVAGIGHTEDIRLPERPRHVARVIDYVLGAWPGHERIDPARVGIFGHSIGGFVALVTVGGAPDLGRVPAYCRQHRDLLCGMPTDTSVPVSAWQRDARIRAAVLAAPTLGFTFSPGALASVTVPIQLWRAANDEITPHPHHAQAVYDALPAAPEYMVVPDAGHFAFIRCTPAMAKRAPAMCRDAPGFDRAAFHRKFDLAVVAFFKAQLPSP